MQPARLAALDDLLSTAGAWTWPHVRRVEPTAATERELLLAHTRRYLEAVRVLSEDPSAPGAESAGLGEGDTPAFAGMHAAAAAIAGGTIAAARAVMRGETEHAFNPGGGMHHARRDRASGFCIYNDLVAAIGAVVQEYEAKVLYLDFDVHHGDGVQQAFYDDPRVLTFSIHETGRYLFPGTGDVLELGQGGGLGYSINLPLTAFTEDGSWLAAIEAVVPALAERFGPDLIVSQFGCDGHTWDGQAHFRLTTNAFARAARLVHEVAHAQAGGRWVATGGGGYDPVRVVPRAWALVWAEMAGRDMPNRLPEPWVQRWAAGAEQVMPSTVLDPPEIVPTIPRKHEIEAENAAVVARVRELALTPRLRLAYRPGGRRAAISASMPAGRTRLLDLPGGPVYLRDRCPESAVQRMRVAEGMQAFARSPERERELLRRIAADPENNLLIAHTAAGEIVGEVSLAPAEGRWADIDGLYEAALEVAPGWRGAGLAEAMLRFAFEADFVEQLVVIALGVSWHWDLARAGLSPWEYRDRLVRLFKTAGFEIFPTDDPEIMSGDANVLMARIGQAAPHGLYEQFTRRLQRASMWRGF
jgi:acetoin utilization deacetylase AcuC-like enzyme/GNAT superfamily N-acetyltransferase